jgi:hypothetical protein
VRGQIRLMGELWRAVARRASSARHALIAGGVSCPGTPRAAVSRPRPRQRPQRGSQAPAAGWRARQDGAKRTAHRLKRSQGLVDVILMTRMESAVCDAEIGDRAILIPCRWIPAKSGGGTACVEMYFSDRDAD